jgi:hypothetical protein
MAQLAVATQVGHEPRQRRPGVGTKAEEARLAVHLDERLPQGAVRPSRPARQRREVVTPEAVEVRGGQAVDVDGAAGLAHRPQEREEDADLRPGVQARDAREAPGNSGEIEAPQHGIRVGVRPDEDRVVAR